MTLLEQFVNEIRDEVIKDIPKPVEKTLRARDVMTMILPELKALMEDLVTVRDRMSILADYWDDRRTNICKYTARVDESAIDSVVKLAKIIDIVKDPEDVVLKANEAAITEYKDAVVTACKAYTEGLFKEELFKNIL